MKKQSKKRIDQKSQLDSNMKEKPVKAFLIKASSIVKENALTKLIQQNQDQRKIQH